MKKTRTAHLWIGLICSIFIFMESLTGLLMNEPWLIGQSQTERGSFQPGQMNQNSFNSNGAAQNNIMPQASNQNGNTSQSQSNSQADGQQGGNFNGQFPGQGGGFDGQRGQGGSSRSSSSLMSIVKGLHEGRIGTTSIKWLIDLVAVAMMILTASGIFLSVRILRSGKRKKGNKTKDLTAQQGIR